MARLVNVDLPRDKRLEVALTYIYGIGRSRALQTLKETGVSGDLRVHQLGDEELVKLRDWIETNYQVEGDLRREVQADIRRKIEIGCYRASGTAAVYPCMASARRPTHAPARARRRPWPARRRSARSSSPSPDPRTDDLQEF
jgi:small subunit ribosomal protein S13